MTAAISRLRPASRRSRLLKAFDMACGACEAHGTMGAICGMRPQDGNPQRVECCGEWGIIADGHGAGRVAVIGVFERDDAAFLRGAAIPPELHR